MHLDKAAWRAILSHYNVTSGNELTDDQAKALEKSLRKKLKQEAARLDAENAVTVEVEVASPSASPENQAADEPGEESELNDWADTALK